jgi:glutamate/aspartate transport system substrate-binding protein
MSLRLIVLFLWTLLCSGIAVAQDESQLSGTLKKIKDAGEIVLGYRDASIPFSYTDAKGRPIGYSLDLCMAIVQDVRAALDNDQLRVRFVHVNSEQRIPFVKDGTIDVECGSTTNTAARQKDVAFSPVIFVTGTKLLVRRTSGIRSYLDLRGKTVSVSAGTTNEAAIRSLSRARALGISVHSELDLQKAFDELASGRADAFATDEVLLYGFLAKRHWPKDLMVVGDYLSYEPYSLMFRRDDSQFSAVVERSFQRLADTRELRWTYDRWFLKPLPSGERIGLDMNPQLVTIFEGLGLLR